MADGTTGFPAGLADAIVARARAFTTALAHARRGDVRGVHRARTASRRLRELLAVAAAACPDAGAGRVRRDVRRLTRALGRVRELDVSLAELGDAAEQRQWAPAAVGAIAGDLTARRERRFAKFQSKLDAIDPAVLGTRLQEVAERLRADPFPRLAERVLGRRVQRRAGQLLTSLDKAGTVYIPAELHAVRIAAKKLRYALEIARATGGTPMGPLLGGLRRAQDVLGRLHDLQVLESCVRDAAARRPSRAAARHERAIEAALEREARAQHAVFLSKRATLTRVAQKARDEVAAALLGRRPHALKAGTAPDDAQAGRARRMSQARRS